MRKLLPILLALVGTGAGIGAGLFLMPQAETAEAAEPSDHAGIDCPTPGTDIKVETAAAAEPESGPSEREYVRMNNQFLVPIVASNAVDAMVVLSLSLEMMPGRSEQVYQREPKLRDDFLQVLFDHANIGGFDGAFTETRRMATLRQALLDVARASLGDQVTDILITEIARQDV